MDKLLEIFEKNKQVKFFLSAIASIGGISAIFLSIGFLITHLKLADLGISIDLAMGEVDSQQYLYNSFCFFKDVIFSPFYSVASFATLFKYSPNSKLVIDLSLILAEILLVLVYHLYNKWRIKELINSKDQIFLDFIEQLNPQKNKSVYFKNLWENLSKRTQDDFTKILFNDKNNSCNSISIIAIRKKIKEAFKNSKFFMTLPFWFYLSILILSVLFSGIVKEIMFENILSIEYASIWQASHTLFFVTLIILIIIVFDTVILSKEKRVQSTLYCMWSSYFIISSILMLLFIYGHTLTHEFHKYPTIQVIKSTREQKKLNSSGKSKTKKFEMKIVQNSEVDIKNTTLNNSKDIRLISFEQNKTTNHLKENCQDSKEKKLILYGKAKIFIKVGDDIEIIDKSDIKEILIKPSVSI